jgi:hypothetical protein
MWLVQWHSDLLHDFLYLLLVAIVPVAACPACA